jgi:hypothetical protein
VNPLVVLTEGFQSAFVACGVLAAIGVALAVVLLGQPLRAPQSGWSRSRRPAPPNEERRASPKDDRGDGAKK